jgi:hypothetical protein
MIMENTNDKTAAASEVKPVAYINHDTGARGFIIGAGRQAQIERARPEHSYLSWEPDGQASSSNDRKLVRLSDHLAAQVHASYADSVKIADAAAMDKRELYVRNCHLGAELDAAKACIERYAAELAAAQRTAGGDAASNVDWLGHALDLEAQAQRVESNTARRAMLSGASALRLMGIAVPQAAQSSAGGDAAGGGYVVGAAYSPASSHRGGTGGGMVLGWPVMPVAEAAAQADDVRAQFNGFDITKLPPILTSCVAKLWPGSNGLFWESALEKMPGRIEQLMQNLAAAPTAQPTQTEQMKALWTPELLAQCEEDSAEVRAVVAAQPTPKGPEVGCERDDGLLNIHAESKTCEVCRAQPTPPDAEPMTGATAPGWVAGPATPLDRLTRYGFDCTLGGDFDENADGPYVKLEDVRAALRQPGALAKPLTRRDINFVKQPPGVIALTLAILWHDGAERPLYTRDDQIAWTGIDAGGHEKSVTVGQLREVLVAALGLPVGTKFGG